MLAALTMKPAGQLLIAPQDVRTADPTIASEIYSGYFAFAGKAVNTLGRSAFEVEAGSPDWLRELAGFSWLRHLRAANSALARANAHALVDDFLSGVGTARQATAWELHVVIRRTLSFLAQSPMILEGVDAQFYRRFMRALARSQRFLERRFAAGLTGTERLFAAIALAELDLCTPAAPKHQRRSSKRLADVLATQILPDGGHVSRNPQVLIDLLLDLLPLRQVYFARATAAPAQLLNAIDRILPMLRLLLHGDGALALFNGMGFTSPDVLATVLAHDDARAKALNNAPHSGYVRVEASDTILIVDTGRPPPAEFSRTAHAGCLAFEFSAGLTRLVVNCGAPDMTRKTAHEAARMTAAHSTLILADTSSCRFAGRRGLEACIEGEVIAGPGHVGLDRENLQEATVLSLAHDGYEATFGLVHERRLILRADGARLDGHDALKPGERRRIGGPALFAVRFHIHLAVTVEPLADGLTALLRLADDERWRFETQPLPLAVEESIFFAAADGAHACRQIVIYGRTDSASEIGWTLRRLDEQARAGD